VIVTIVIFCSLACCRARDKASSPAVSRFEFGSSRTTNFGLPKKARAKAIRCFCPPESGAPSAATKVS
jgi:hypothetical protein